MGSFGLGHERFNLIIPHISFPQAHIHGIFYAKLNVDFLNANGAGNVKSFIDNLKAFVPDSKKIVVFFDRDNAGKDGVQAITGISKNDGRVAHYQDIVQDNITTSFIPYKDGVTEGDFLIEDS